MKAKDNFTVFELRDQLSIMFNLTRFKASDTSVEQLRLDMIDELVLETKKSMKKFEEFETNLFIWTLRNESIIPKRANIVNKMMILYLKNPNSLSERSALGLLSLIAKYYRRFMEKSLVFLLSRYIKVERLQGFDLKDLVFNSS